MKWSMYMLIFMPIGAVVGLGVISLVIRRMLNVSRVTQRAKASGNARVTQVATRREE